MATSTWRSPAAWTFANANYLSQSGNATVTITQVGSTVTVSASNATYDGQSHGGSASWTSSGADQETAGLTVHYVGIGGTTYDSDDAPSSAGAYRVSATYSIPL